MTAEQRAREAFFSLVGRQLKRLYHFVRHQLAYDEAIGDLEREEIAPEEVVDAVVLRAYRRFREKPRGRKVESWLLGLAREQMRDAVRRSRARRSDTTSLEEDVPETPPAEAVSTLGDEILDF